MTREELSVLGFMIPVFIVFFGWLTKCCWQMYRWTHCKACHCRVKKWVQWHQREGETDYNGWVWCPLCGYKQWEGFEDRAFG